MTRFLSKFLYNSWLAVVENSKQTPYTPDGVSVLSKYGSLVLSNDFTTTADCIISWLKTLSIQIRACSAYRENCDQLYTPYLEETLSNWPRKTTSVDKIKILVFYQETKETGSWHPWSGHCHFFRRRSWSCHLLSWSFLSTGGSLMRVLLLKFKKMKEKSYR